MCMHAIFAAFQTEYGSKMGTLRSFSCLKKDQKIPVIFGTKANFSLCYPPTPRRYSPMAPGVRSAGSILKEQAISQYITLNDDNDKQPLNTTHQGRPPCLSACGITQDPLCQMANDWLFFLLKRTADLVPLPAHALICEHSVTRHKVQWHLTHLFRAVKGCHGTAERHLCDVLHMVTSQGNGGHTSRIGPFETP